MADTFILFDVLTDEEILFNDKDEANAFFARFRVPAAAPGSGGFVKMADIIADANLPTSDLSYFNVYIDDILIGTAPTYTNFIQLKAAFNELQAQFNTLLQKMKDAGMMTS